MYLFLLCLFSITFVSFVKPTPCPDVNLAPCSCYDDDVTAIECMGASLTLSAIQSVIKSLKSSDVSFNFVEADLGNIPSDLFEGQKSVEVNIETCKIESFDERPFTGLENSLEVLNIFKSIDKNIKHLNTFRLGHLKKLKVLYFMHNDIGKLGNEMFESGPESLEIIHMEKSGIKELGDKAFASLKNIKQIWLRGNSLKKVSRSMFPNPANNLEKLEISLNSLEELPDDMFVGFPALKMVDLGNNKLKTLPEKVWGPIWNQLELVYIDKNEEFVCDEELKWIYEQKLPEERFSGTCGGANKLSGRKLDSLTLADFE